MLAHQGSTDTGLNYHKWGLPPQSSEFMIQTNLILPIQYQMLAHQGSTDTGLNYHRWGLPP
jgi:hypothetical protein